MSDCHLILFPPIIVMSATQTEVLLSSHSSANHLCSVLMSSASSKVVQTSLFGHWIEKELLQVWLTPLLSSEVSIENSITNSQWNRYFFKETSMRMSPGQSTTWQIWFAFMFAIKILFFSPSALQAKDNLVLRGKVCQYTVLLPYEIM